MPVRWFKKPSGEVFSALCRPGIDVDEIAAYLGLNADTVELNGVWVGKGYVTLEQAKEVSAGLGQSQEQPIPVSGRPLGFLQWLLVQLRLLVPNDVRLLEVIESTREMMAQVLQFMDQTQQELDLSDADVDDEQSEQQEQQQQQDQQQQQEQQQCVPTIHVADVATRGVGVAAMRMMVQQELDLLRASGTYQQQQQGQQPDRSPGDRRVAARQGRVMTRQQTAARSSAHSAHIDWAAADTGLQNFADVMKAAVEDVAEEIEECADADMSALDQCRGTVCNPSSRFYHTLKYGLPAALAAERTTLNSQPQAD